MSNSLLLANKLILKYASISAETIRDSIEKSIHQAILNASKWGKDSDKGIMNFKPMIDNDQVTLDITLTKNDLFGRADIIVREISISDPNLAVKYQPLKNQIEEYLNKNEELFPQHIDNQTVDYSNFAILLSYSPS